MHFSGSIALITKRWTPITGALYQSSTLSPFQANAIYICQKNERMIFLGTLNPPSISRSHHMHVLLYFRRKCSCVSGKNPKTWKSRSSPFFLWSGSAPMQWLPLVLSAMGYCHLLPHLRGWTTLRHCRLPSTTRLRHTLRCTEERASTPNQPNKSFVNMPQLANYLN